MTNTTKSIAVKNMSCQGCAKTIQREVGAVKGVKAVTADPATQLVTVEFQPPATWDAITATLTEIGYPPTPSRA